jgi:hypothetical protein
MMKHSSERRVIPASGHRVIDLVDGLNRRLLPLMGPAQLGDPNEPLVAPLAHGGPCPLCGLPMDEHVLERSPHDTYLICPAPGEAAKE